MNKVSVVLATYNGEKFLREQLDSILAQSYEIYELIIVDDCSSDSTLDIISSYMSKYAFIKLYINEINFGVAQTFSRGLSLSSGEFIALCDQDDVWHVNKIKTLMNCIGDNWLIHSDASLIDANGVLLEKSLSRTQKNIYRDSFCELLMTNIVTGCTVLLRREILDKAIPIPKGVYMHDYYLALIASYFNKIAYCDCVLTMYRQHGGNVEGVEGVDYLGWQNKQKKENIASILDNYLFKNNADVINALRVRESIYSNKCLDSSSILWYFKRFGIKRLCGLILRSCFGTKIGGYFYNLRQRNFQRSRTRHV